MAAAAAAAATDVAAAALTAFYVQLNANMMDAPVGRLADCWLQVDGRR
jgi:hypothetical protein